MRLRTALLGVVLAACVSTPSAAGGASGRTTTAQPTAPPVSIAESTYGRVVARTAPGARTPPFGTLNKGEDVVIDGRFAEGKYEYVCDPHAAVGMKGTLVVKSGGAAAGKK
jgi:hypothetical protein